MISGAFLIMYDEDCIISEENNMPCPFVDIVFIEGEERVGYTELVMN